MPPFSPFPRCLTLLFAAQCRQEPAQNPISKLCLHPTSPKSDFEQPSQENARFLLPQATPKSLPKPTQIEKFAPVFRGSLSFYRYVLPKALASSPLPATKTILKRFFKPLASILETFLLDFGCLLATSNLQLLVFSL